MQPLRHRQLKKAIRERRQILLRLADTLAAGQDACGAHGGVVSGVQWHHQGHIDVHVSTKAHHHTASQYVLHPEAPTFRPAPPGTSMFSSLPLPDGQALVPLRAHIIC